MKVSFTALLGLLFIGLKLGGVIAWSWFWVLAPFWIPVVVVLILLLGAVLGVGAVTRRPGRR